jgi:hypothetical protein
LAGFSGPPFIASFWIYEGVDLDWPPGLSALVGDVVKVISLFAVCGVKGEAGSEDECE